VDQTTPYDSTASTDKSSSGTDSLAVTVTSGGMVVDAASFSGVLTASGGMTQVAQRSTGYGYSACGYLANATAAVWTFSGSDYFVHTAVSLKTVAAAAESSGSATLGDITAAGGKRERYCGERLPPNDRRSCSAQNRAVEQCQWYRYDQ